MPGHRTELENTAAFPPKQIPKCTGNEARQANLAEEAYRLRSHLIAWVLPKDWDAKIPCQGCPGCPSCSWHRAGVLNAKTHKKWTPLVWNPSATPHYLQVFIIKTDLFSSIICLHSNFGLSNLVWRQGHLCLLLLASFIYGRIWNESNTEQILQCRDKEAPVQQHDKYLRMVTCVAAV